MTTRSLALIVAACALVLRPAVVAIEQPGLQRLTILPGAMVPLADAPEPARRVQIDAVVTDRHGKPILGLRPGDFQIVENGVSQRIEKVDVQTVSVSTATSVEPIDSDEAESRAATQPGTRLIALVLDEFHVSGGPATERVRAALLQFVDTELRPSDLVVVLKPLDSVTSIRFTRDREAARAAIRDFSGRKGDFRPKTQFEELYLGRSQEAVRRARAQIVASVLRAVTMRIGELEARRAAVVLVSEGFVRPERRRDAGRRLPDLPGLVRAASRYHVAIYAFNPAVDSERPVVVNDPPDPDQADDTLERLATETGGQVVLDGSRLSDALRRVSRDLDSYYVLSYTSSHRADGRYYTVQVTTKRQDAQVRARTGYWAPLRGDELRRRTGDLPSRPMRVLRRSVFIEPWFGLALSPRGTPHVIVTWEPAEPRGVKKVEEAHTVHLTALSATGVPLYDGLITAARAGGIGSTRADRAAFPASPGRVELNLRILRADGTELDAATHDVQVPDFRADAATVILPPQLFRTSSAREFRELLADPDAAPVPDRNFRRTERLLLRVPTYPSGSGVTLTASLKNRRGQTLHTMQPTREQGSAGGATQYDLPLAWLAPGEYSIELTASGPSGTVRELIRFRLTG